MSDVVYSRNKLRAVPTMQNAPLVLKQFLEGADAAGQPAQERTSVVQWCETAGMELPTEVRKKIDAETMRRAGNELAKNVEYLCATIWPKQAPDQIFSQILHAAGQANRMLGLLKEDTTGIVEARGLPTEAKLPKLVSGAMQNLERLNIGSGK